MALAFYTDIVKWHFDLNPDVGKFDKYVRSVSGTTLFGVTLVTAPTPVGWMVMLPLIAVPIFITTIIGSHT